MIYFGTQFEFLPRIWESAFNTLEYTDELGGKILVEVLKIVDRLPNLIE
ncbi:Uncharacterised protein [Pannonibacter phragmitetus]|uniref:Uncharacterized protein n=1 Tax=Pannonibacter phragmitetus TaxID=121719 RepID=A0A378ZXP6_9HYPH|nr:Uncharacterised protein [Pannonibacter phragmitetus]